MSLRVAVLTLLLAGSACGKESDNGVQPQPKPTETRILGIQPSSGGIVAVLAAKPDGSVVDTIRTRVGFPIGASPDGVAIAYIGTYRQDSASIWLASSRAAAPIRLVSLSGVIPVASWSADGTSLYFAYWSGSIIPNLNIYSGHLYQVPRAGGPPTRLTTFDDTVDEWSGSVAPDGKRLVFASVALSQRESGSLVTWLWTGRVGTSEAKRIVPADTNVAYQYPSWSPDGSRIAAIRYRAIEDDWQIVVISPDGSDLRVIPTNGLAPARVQWSPDSQSLVFATGGNPAYLVGTVPADGSAAPKMLPALAGSSWPVWSNWAP